MSTIRNAWLSLRLAFGMLTRLPVGDLTSVAAQHWRLYTAAFPLVGWILALIAFAPAALLVAWHGRPSPQASFLLACISTALLAYLTRGLHLDGWADTCDALGGGFTPERRLEILKDSHIGSFGTIALCLLLLTKTAALAVLFTAGQLPGCVGVVVLSRLSMCLLSAVGEYPRKDGTAARTVGNVRPAAVGLAVAFSLPVVLAPELVPAAAAMALIVLRLRRRARHAFGGVTGDVLGACCEMCETVGYATVAILVL